MPEMIKLILDGEVQPKARPRVTKNGTFMPREYKDWKDEAILQFQNQFKKEPIPKVEKVEVRLIGKHSRRSDADNLLGAILDALVQGLVLKNDNLVCVNEVNLKLFYNQGRAVSEVYIYVS